MSPAACPASRPGQAAEDAGTCRAKRFALKYDPPCIFLEYVDASGKTRVREVKMSKVTPDVEADRLTRKVIRSFPRQIDPASVKYDQVRKLVVKVLEHVRKAAVGGGAQAVGASSREPGALTMPTPRLAHSMSPKLPEAGGNREPGVASSSSHHHASLDSDGRLSTSSIGAGGGLFSPAFSPAAGGGGPGGVGGLLPRAKHPLALASHPLTAISPMQSGRNDADDVDDLMQELDREMGTPASRPSSATNGPPASGAAAAANGYAVGGQQHQRQPLPSSTSAVSLGGLSDRSLAATEGTSGSDRDAGPSAGGAQQPGGGKSRFAAEAKDRSGDGSDDGVLSINSDVGGRGPAGPSRRAQAGDGDDDDDDGSGDGMLTIEPDIGGDLNHVTETELKLAKAAMEKAFLENQLRPGDASYVWDKEVEFGPADDSNDWDEDGDEDDNDEKESPAPGPQHATGAAATGSSGEGPVGGGAAAPPAYAPKLGSPHSSLKVDVGGASGARAPGSLATGTSGAKDSPTPTSAASGAGLGTGRSGRRAGGGGASDLDAEFSYGDVRSPGGGAGAEVSPTAESVDDDEVSPTRVGIDSDMSSLDLPGA
ncbi:hypothetical protein FOA52_008989 [Chlamydomonas sp. UWO 241]|nr:hypothetical protein FOA52_008989 [Chlamydomonas sp. UWO 241]